MTRKKIKRISKFFFIEIWLSNLKKQFKKLFSPDNQAVIIVFIVVIAVMMNKKL